MAFLRGSESEKGSAQSMADDPHRRGMDTLTVSSLKRCYEVPESTHTSHLLITRPNLDSVRFSFNPHQDKSHADQSSSSSGLYSEDAKPSLLPPVKNEAMGAHLQFSPTLRSSTTDMCNASPSLMSSTTSPSLTSPSGTASMNMEPTQTRRPYYQPVSLQSTNSAKVMLAIQDHTQVYHPLPVIDPTCLQSIRTVPVLDPTCLQRMRTVNIERNPPHGIGPGHVVMLAKTCAGVSMKQFEGNARKWITSNGSKSISMESDVSRDESETDSLETDTADERETIFAITRQRDSKKRKLDTATDQQSAGTQVDLGESDSNTNTDTADEVVDTEASSRKTLQYRYCDTNAGRFVYNEINIARREESQSSNRPATDRSQNSYSTTGRGQGHMEKAMSVADRIEIEIKQCINRRMMSIRARGSSDLPVSTSLPGNGLPNMQRTISNASSACLSVAERIEMQLSENRNAAHSYGNRYGISSLHPREEMRNDKPCLGQSENTTITPNNEEERRSEENPETVAISSGDDEDEDDDEKVKNPKSLTLFFTTGKLYELIIEEKSESEFICRNCKMSFSNKLEARNHVKIHNPFRCVACDLTFCTQADMLAHEKTEHNKILHCTYCLYNTDSKTRYKRHLKSTHRQTRLWSYAQAVCYICGLLFPVWDPLDEHMLKEHGIEKTMLEGDFRCPLCNAISKSDRHLRDHVRKHRGQFLECPHPNCDYKGLSQSRLNKHCKMIHTEARTFCCHLEGCDAKFKTRNGYEEHLNVVHYKIRNFFCDTCGKGFLAKKHLSVHRLIHSDIKPVGCKFCDYRCRQRASLKWHMKRSHPEIIDETTDCRRKDTNQLKRGRKATGKKSAKQREKISCSIYSKKMPSKRRASTSESEQDEDSCSQGTFQDSDSNDRDGPGTPASERQEDDGICPTEASYPKHSLSGGLGDGSSKSEAKPVRMSTRKRRKTEKAETFSYDLEKAEEQTDNEPD